VRIGTEGFEFNVFDRSIFNPDTDGDGQVTDQETLEFFFDGVRTFGARDNVDDIFIDPVTGQIRGLVGVDLGNPGQIATYPDCVDTIVGDFFNCPSATDGFRGTMRRRANSPSRCPSWVRSRRRTALRTIISSTGVCALSGMSPTQPGLWLDQHRP
jgi:hypothetical protein